MYTPLINSRDERGKPVQLPKFAGVDYLHSPTEIASFRSPYAPNMINEQMGSVQKRVGFRDLHSISNSAIPISSMVHYSQNGKNQLLYAKLTIDMMTNTMRLYSCDIENGVLNPATEKTILTYEDAGFSSYKFSSFYHGGYMYILIGGDAQSLTNPSEHMGALVRYNGTTVEPVSAAPGLAGNLKAYVPLTHMNCDPVTGAGDATGTPINLLRPGLWKVSYNTVTGTKNYKVLNAAYTQPPSATLNGVPLVYSSDFTYDDDHIKLTSDPGNSENGLVVFIENDGMYSGRSPLSRCTIATSYGRNNDNRFFLTGNSEFPNRVWYSAIDDPTYFPENNYLNIGDSSAPIMGFLKINDALAAVKGNQNFDAAVHLITSSTNPETGLDMFPVKEGVEGSGAVSKACFASLSDEPLYLSQNGLKALVSSAVTQTRNIQDRSLLVNRVLLEGDLTNALAIVYKNKYYLAVGSDVFVADGRQKSSEFGYEWQHWTGFGVTAWCEVDGELWFARAEQEEYEYSVNPVIPIICKLNTDLPAHAAYTDNGKPLYAAWTTPVFTFGNAFAKKIVEKKGTGFLMENGVRTSCEILYAMDGKEFVLANTVAFDAPHGESNQTLPIGMNKRVRNCKTLQMRCQNNQINETMKLYGAQIMFSYGLDTKGVVK